MPLQLRLIGINMLLLTKEIEKMAKDMMNVESEVAQYDLGDLFLHDLNPRKGYLQGEIEAMAASIQALGLLQNLSGLRDDGGRVGVVAGGKRLAALKHLEQQGHVLTVPVRVTDCADQAALWAVGENTVRSRPHVADEVRGFMEVAKKGFSDAEIAEAFGVTELTVTKRLALGALPDDVLNALRKDDITFEIARLLTTAPDEQKLKDAFDLAMSGESPYRVKSFLSDGGLTEGTRITEFVTRDRYTEAGGRIQHDLFENEMLWLDLEIAMTLFQELGQKIAGEYSDAGWAWANFDGDAYYIQKFELERKGYILLDGQVPDLGVDLENELSELKKRRWNDDFTDEDEARMEALKDRKRPVFSDKEKAVSGVMIAVDHAGCPSVCSGVVRPEDVGAAIAAGVVDRPDASEGEDTSKPKESGAAFTGALTKDLNAVRLHACQMAVSGNQKLALDFAIYSLSGVGGSYGVSSLLDLSTGDPEVIPSVDDGFAYDVGLKRPSEGMTFEDFQNLDDASKMGLLARGVARLVKAGNGFARKIAEVEALTGGNMRECWTPTHDGFFKRITSAQLDTLIKSLLDWEDDNEDWCAFKPLKKGKKAEILDGIFKEGSPERAAYGVTPAQIEKIDRWVPEYSG